MKNLFLLLLLLPLTAVADGGLPTQPYIYVEGKAEVEKPADLVTLRFSLAGRAPDQAVANKQVQEKANAVFALLDRHKISDQDIIASDLNSEAEYEELKEPASGRGRLKGFVVTRPFSVKLRDVKAFPKLVNEILAIGVSEFSGIEPGLSKEKDVADEVWTKALADARDRAEKIAKAIDSKIDSTFAASPVAFSSIRQDIFGGSLGPAQAAGYSAEARREIVASRYQLAPITTTQSVHVIYLISPAK